MESILNNAALFSDQHIRSGDFSGSTVGMNSIKDRRLGLPLQSHTDLMVGNCVPFYFCPRSIMLYLLHMGNHPEVTYSGGQGPIVHLVADAYSVIEWASRNRLRWAITLSNAGSGYFEDRCTVSGFEEVNWEAVNSTKWSGNGISREIKEGKQAEFLCESWFPWELIQEIGVSSGSIGSQVVRLLADYQHRPQVLVRKEWYY